MWVRSKKQEFQQNVIGGGGGGGLVAKSYPTLVTPMDCSPPGSSVHRIFQARTLEWVAMPFSRECDYNKPNTNRNLGQTHMGILTSS